MTRYRFGDFAVDDDTIEVLGPDGVREVEPQVFRVLAYLVANADRLVTKEELLDNVWGDRFVSESALTTRIKQARRAVDDDGATQWAIKTIHGRGYRFVADVTDVTAGPGPAAPGPVTAPSAGELPDELRPDVVSPLCGRAAELDRCLGVVARPDHQDRFGWVWLLGEPGIGKTRLAAEVARHAHAAGHRVLFSRNNEDLRVPYQPFIEVLRAMLRHGDDDELVPPGLEPLAPAGAAAQRGAGSSGESEALRYELFEAVADWLAGEADRQPLTIVVDDIHWGSESTLQLFAHLQGRPVGGNVTFVMTARDTAPDVNPRVLDMIGAAQGDPATAVLRLEGLTGEDALALVGDAAVDLDEVLRQTAGNPLFLQAVSRIDGSADIAAAVHRRLTTLEQRVQDTLRLVSVIGLEFELTVAAAANGLDELDLLDVLEQAVASHLVDDIGADRFRFTHALVRSSLRDELSSARRARMHERVASALAEVYGDRPDRLPELAFHTAEAATASRPLRPLAIERLRAAAAHSASQLSYADAAELLARAFEFADELGPAERARLARDRGVVEAYAGRNMAAAAAFEVAVDEARVAGDVELLVDAALWFEDATWRPAEAARRALAFTEESIAALDAAVAAGQSIADEPSLRARLAVARFRSLALLGRRAEADEAFDEARALATELRAPTIEATLISVYLGQLLNYEDAGEWGGMVRRLAELEGDIDDVDVSLRAIHDQFLHAVFVGDRAAQESALARMDEVQHRFRSGFWRFIQANEQAMLAHYHGDLDAAERLAFECRALAADVQGPAAGGTFGLRMFTIRREQDRLAAVAPLVEHVLATNDGDVLWTPGLAFLLAETGAADDAATVLAPIKAAGFDLPRDGMWSTVMVFLIETAVALGDVESCAVLRDRFAHLAGANVMTGSGLLCFGRADRHLGVLSFVLGDLDAAEEHLGRALEGDVAGGSVLWGNESRLWLSRVRRAQGHAAEADAMAEVVAAECGPPGLARLVRLAEAELAG